MSELMISNTSYPVCTTRAAEKTPLEIARAVRTIAPGDAFELAPAWARKLIDVTAAVPAAVEPAVEDASPQYGAVMSALADAGELATPELLARAFEEVTSGDTPGLATARLLRGVRALDQLEGRILAGLVTGADTQPLLGRYGAGDAASYSMLADVLGAFGAPAANVPAQQGRAPRLFDNTVRIAQWGDPNGGPYTTCGGSAQPRFRFPPNPGRYAGDPSPVRIARWTDPQPGPETTCGGSARPRFGAPAPRPIAGPFSHYLREVGSSSPSSDPRAIRAALEMLHRDVEQALAELDQAEHEGLFGALYAGDEEAAATRDMLARMACGCSTR